MLRRDFLKTSSAGFAASFFSTFPALALDESGFTTLRRDVGTFEGSGGTIGWLATDEAVVVVDAQFPTSAPACIAGIQQRSSHRIDFLINTHHHGDHTDGNITFRPHTDHIVAHESVPRFQTARNKEKEMDAWEVADITFERAMTFDLGVETVHLSYHGRAHTSGDAVIHFEKADVVHVGDLVFNRSPAYIDREAAATITGWMDVLETVHGRFTDETIFIFGHGKTITGDRSDLLYKRDFLGGLLTFTEAGIKAGKSKDEIAETKRLPAFPDNYSDDWEEGIPNCLKVAYDELTED